MFSSMLKLLSTNLFPLYISGSQSIINTYVYLRVFYKNVLNNKTYFYLEVILLFSYLRSDSSIIGQYQMTSAFLLVMPTLINYDFALQKFQVQLMLYLTLLSLFYLIEPLKQLRSMSSVVISPKIEMIKHIRKGKKLYNHHINLGYWVKDTQK